MEWNYSCLYLKGTRKGRWQRVEKIFWTLPSISSQIFCHKFLFLQDDRTTWPCTSYPCLGTDLSPTTSQHGQCRVGQIGQCSETRHNHWREARLCLAEWIWRRVSWIYPYHLVSCSPHPPMTTALVPWCWHSPGRNAEPDQATQTACPEMKIIVKHFPKKFLAFLNIFLNF